MLKEYKKIEFVGGSRLEDAVYKLLKFKAQGIFAYGDFDGTILYSDTVTMDAAYKEHLGQTKCEFDKAKKMSQQNQKNQMLRYEKKLKELTLIWVEQGKEILTKDKWKEWEKIVPIQLADVHQGKVLRDCLDIVKILNNNGSFNEAKVEIKNQDHNNNSFKLICDMIESFCSRGSEFVKCMNNMEELMVNREFCEGCEHGESRTIRDWEGENVTKMYCKILKRNVYTYMDIWDKATVPDDCPQKTDF